MGGKPSLARFAPKQRKCAIHAGYGIARIMVCELIHTRKTERALTLSSPRGGANWRHVMKRVVIACELNFAVVKGAVSRPGISTKRIAASPVGNLLARRACKRNSGVSFVIAFLILLI